MKAKKIIIIIAIISLILLSGLIFILKSNKPKEEKVSPYLTFTGHMGCARKISWINTLECAYAFFTEDGKYSFFLEGDYIHSTPDNEKIKIEGNIKEYTKETLYKIDGILEVHSIKRVANDEKMPRSSGKEADEALELAKNFASATPNNTGEFSSEPSWTGAFEDTEKPNLWYVLVYKNYKYYCYNVNMNSKAVEPKKQLKKTTEPISTIDLYKYCK